MTNLPEQLQHHLAQIENEQLRAAITNEFEQLNKRFGLVFERHMPEGVRLPGHRITRGTKVAITHKAGKPVKDPSFYTVASRVTKDTETVTLADSAGNTFEHPLSEIVAAKEFGDITYPGLKVIDQVRRDERPDAPTHAIINGENHHVLEALQWTHAGKVDLIYIDPPYNTGNADWKYNDRYVDGNDGYRHSKWLSFMEKRLVLAKKLLKDTGTLFMSIDDNEQARLKVLCDQVFGEDNFIDCLAVSMNAKGRMLSRYFASNHEYVLVYRKSAACSIDPSSAENTHESDFPESDTVGRFRFINLMNTNKKFNPTNRPNLYYPIFVDRQSGALSLKATGETDQVLPTFASGAPGVWTWGKEKFEREHHLLTAKLTAGKLKVYRRDYMGEGRRKKHKTHLDHSFMGLTDTGTKELESILGSGLFPSPKPTRGIKNLIAMMPSDAVVLDFFGGSGTTAEAVMRLNAEDGGTRSTILVTNNELSKTDDTKLRKAGHKPGDAEYEALGVFHHVTKPRLKTVATGIREDSSTYSEGLEANLAFMEFKYLEEVDILQGKSINDLAGLFWLKAGGRGTVPVVTAEDERRGYALSDGMAILLSTGAARELKSEVSTRGVSLDALFIVTDSDAQGDEAAALFAGTPAIERIYGPYLEAFQVNKNG